MMAKRVPRSTVMELTLKAEGRISGPACSAVFCTCATGFQPMGQKGLRPLASSVNADVFFSAIGLSSSAPAAAKSLTRFALRTNGRWHVLNGLNITCNRPKTSRVPVGYSPITIMPIFALASSFGWDRKPTARSPCGPRPSQFPKEGDSESSSSMTITKMPVQFPLARSLEWERT